MVKHRVGFNPPPWVSTKFQTSSLEFRGYPSSEFKINVFRSQAHRSLCAPSVGCSFQIEQCLARAFIRAMKQRKHKQ